MAQRSVRSDGHAIHDYFFTDRDSFFGLNLPTVDTRQPAVHKETAEETFASTLEQGGNSLDLSIG